jgi:hypothetical protein
MRQALGCHSISSSKKDKKWSVYEACATQKLFSFPWEDRHWRKNLEFHCPILVRKLTALKREIPTDTGKVLS